MPRDNQEASKKVCGFCRFAVEDEIKDEIVYIGNTKTRRETTSYLCSIDEMNECQRGWDIGKHFVAME